MNISETIKNITTHLVNSKACNLNVYMEYSKMFNVSSEHHWSHDTHQADSPTFAKRVPALHCQWLQQLLLFVPSAHLSLKE